MYKIHDYSDKSPTAFESTDEIIAQKTTRITDGKRILATVNLYSTSDTGFPQFTSVKKYNAFIQDLLMLPEYKAAWTEKQEGISNLSKVLDSRSPEQLAFETWCKGKTLRWVYNGVESRGIIFDHWVMNNEFRDTDGNHWTAFGHGFLEYTELGHYFRIVEPRAEFQEWAGKDKIIWISTVDDCPNAPVTFKSWGKDLQFYVNESCTPWYAHGHGFPDCGEGRWEKFEEEF